MRAVTLCLCGLMLWTGCQPSSNTPAKPSSNKLRVVATTGMVADLVRRIGGDEVEVEQLMISGVDPHLYKPNTDDARSIKSADIVFYNGFKLEGRMGDLLGKQSRANHEFIAIAESIPKENVLGDPKHEAVDPHVWMDVSLWMATTHSIEQALAKRIPSQAKSIAERASQLREELERLDAQGKKWIASIPESQRVLVTSHDAFRYFGKRYGLQVEGIQGISTSSDASLKRITELIDMIYQRKVPAVFVESSVSEKEIRSLLEGVNSRGASLKIGGQLYSDAMGPAGSGADTYVGMMTHNFKVIAQSLGGNFDSDTFSKSDAESNSAKP